MRALILASGRQRRWRESGGIGYKQLIEVDGEALIRRTFRLACERCPDVLTVVSDPGLSCWQGLNPVTPAHEPWMGEMGKFLDHRDHWPEDGDVVVLYGDAYYTEACLDTIFSHEPTQPTIYGRAHAEGERRSESFAIRFRVEDRDELIRVAKACADAGYNNRGGPWRWFFYRHTGRTSYSKADRAHLSELATEANGWVECGHDASDDFDEVEHLRSWRREHGAAAAA